MFFFYYYSTNLSFDCDLALIFHLKIVKGREKIVGYFEMLEGIKRMGEIKGVTNL